MAMILTSVTMVGWADVPDSDWGDFRRRRAVDISSSDWNQNISIHENAFENAVGKLPLPFIRWKGLRAYSGNSRHRNWLIVDVLAPKH